MITGEYPPDQGGVGDFTAQLTTALTAQGHTLHVLTHRRIPPTSGVDPLIEQWTPLSLSLAREWAVKRSLDVINLQFETAAYAMSPYVHFLPRALRETRVITTFHDLHAPYLFPLAGRLRGFWLGYLARNSAGCIVTNPEDFTGLTTQRRVDPKHVRQIPIGSNIQVSPPPDYDRQRWREQAGIPRQAFLIGYFGFLNASKGVDALIETLPSLIDLNPYLMLIGGKTGNSDPANEFYARQITAMIRNRGLGERVKETGYVTAADVSAHLLACDLVVLPFRDGVSYRRGSFMAALAHGCPILTTPPTIPYPELTDGVALTPVDQLGSAIRHLATDSAQRDQLRAGAVRLSERFNWDRIATETTEFLAR